MFLQEQIDRYDACEEKTKFRFEGSTAPKYLGGMSSFQSIKEGLGVRGREYSTGKVYGQAVALRDALVKQLAKIRAPAPVSD